jgi:hypothetical protein
MTPKFCRGCKETHDPLMSCSVAKRIATNATHEPQKPVEKPVVHAVEKVVHGDRHKKTPGRMFYRRFWMQTRRAVEAGRACLWPKGI